jgi:hypothetical protein
MTCVIISFHQSITIRAHWVTILRNIPAIIHTVWERRFCVTNLGHLCTIIQTRFICGWFIWESSYPRWWILVMYWNLLCFRYSWLNALMDMHSDVQLQQQKLQWLKKLYSHAPIRLGKTLKPKRSDSQNHKIKKSKIVWLFLLRIYASHANQYLFLLSN